MTSLKTNPETWIDRFGDYLYSIAYFKTSDQELAQDLVQDTFLSALKAKDTFEGKSSEKTWLTTILNHKIIDHYRRTNRSASIEDYLTDTEESFEQRFFDKDNNGHWQAPILKNHISERPDQYLISKEFQAYLQDCLYHMPTKIKAIFLAKYFDDQTAAHICKENEISSSNYWVIIYRAKIILRNCLEQKGMM